MKTVRELFDCTSQIHIFKHTTRKIFVQTFKYGIWTDTSIKRYVSVSKDIMSYQQRYVDFKLLKKQSGNMQFALQNHIFQLAVRFHRLSTSSKSYNNLIKLFEIQYCTCEHLVIFCVCNNNSITRQFADNNISPKFFHVLNYKYRDIKDL